MNSTLETIFLAQLYYASDAKVVSRDIIFLKLIKTLKLLKTDGITNLGLNSIGGFAESFTSK